MSAAPPELTQLQQAHAELTAFIQIIPDDALDWHSADGEWPLKETIAHVAHAYDFYILILDQARAQDFTSVTMRNELPGWQALFCTDDAVKSCQTTSAVLSALQQAYDHVLTHFQTITHEELDRPFTYDSTRPDEPPYTTTLRYRVLQKAISHIHEHIPQLHDTLARWATDTEQ